MLPISGSIFLVRPLNNLKWKQDGHIYLKRKEGNGFREDTLKMKLSDNVKITCHYSFITDLQGKV